MMPPLTCLPRLCRCRARTFPTQPSMTQWLQCGALDHPQSSRCDTSEDCTQLFKLYPWTHGSPVRPPRSTRSWRWRWGQTMRGGRGCAPASKLAACPPRYSTPTPGCDPTPCRGPIIVPCTLHPAPCLPCSLPHLHRARCCLGGTQPCGIPQVVSAPHHWSSCKAVSLTVLHVTRPQVRDLERVYLRMWDIHCAGQPPHTFEV